MQDGGDGSETGSCVGRIRTLLGETESLLRAVRFEEAVNRARQAVHLAEVCGAAPPALQAESLLILASMLEEVGEPTEALVRAEEAVDRFEALSNDAGDEGLASALVVLGRLATVLGDGERAEKALLRAVRLDERLHGVDHPEVAADLSALGALYERQGRFDEAERALSRSLEIDRRASGDDHPRTASGRSDLAMLLMGSGEPADLDRAETLLLRALEIHRREHGELHPAVATDLTNLAGLHVLRGEHASAEPLLRRAVEIDQQLLGDLHPDLLTGLSNLAWSLAALGRPQESLEWMRLVVERDTRLINRVFSVSSERRRSDFVDEIRENLEGFLSLVLHHLCGSPEAVRLGFELVLRRKGLELEALAAGRELAESTADQATRKLAEELRNVRRRLGELQLAPAVPPEEGPVLEQEGAALEAREEDLETELARALPRLDLERRLHAVDSHRLAAALPPASWLIEILRFQPFHEAAVPTADDGAWGGSRYVAFLLPAGTPEDLQMIDLGEAEPIDRAVLELRRRLDPWGRSARVPYRAPRNRPPSPPQEDGFEIWARELRRRVIDPLVRRRGQTGIEPRHLLVSPDGPLAAVPFEVLPDRSRGFLSDRYEIHYLSAARDVLRATAAGEPRPERAVVLADPDFDLGGIPWQRPFGALPGTREEGRRIARLLDAELWLGEEALEGPLRGVDSPEILHLATHGFFFTEDEAGFARLPVEDPMLRSGLALAGANTRLRGDSLPPEAGDGLLPAKDVAGLDLRRTRLVVLSACETGLGEVRSGEGVLGLRRAFVLAGAGVQVVSLWSVPDAETRTLMVDLYERMLDGQSPAEALRGARHALRRRHPDPRVWGAFVCVGPPEAKGRQPLERSLESTGSIRHPAG